MGYHVGTAASFAELKTHIEAALVADGWALASGILVQGAGAFGLTASAAELQLRAGTGHSGSTLTNAAPNHLKVGNLSVRDPIVWPVRYEVHVHAAPAEAFVLINYNVDAYQHLAFGVSPAAGIPGTGVWMSGSMPAYTSVSHTHVTPTYNSLTGVNPNQASGALAGLLATGGMATITVTSAYWHDGLDLATGPTGWCPIRERTTPTYAVADGMAQNGLAIASLRMRAPSASNLVTPLIPIYGVRNRTQNGASIGVALSHARYCRLDHHPAEDVITFAGDRWKLYPDYRRNASVRDGLSSVTNIGMPHSGTFGFAVRYLGP